ncbi:MAG: UDP-glucose 4-epimerase GalE [Microgenomates group bacterium]
MILIVGGAGYIGSHVNKLLSEMGYQTVVFDNLSTGHRESVKWGELVEGDLANIHEIENVFTKYNMEAVLDFASFIEVGESVVDPQKYYQNNVVNSLNLLGVMKKFEVNKIVFSSTAAVYGNPQKVPIVEDSPLLPINPYGKTKLMLEMIFADYDKAYGLKSVCFRYFNACGADRDGEIGEGHTPESHLIPRILKYAKGELPEFKLFGTDFETKDGTCVRDYIHVEDLAKAHLMGLKHLLNSGESKIFNLGSGSGYSNKEIANAAREVTGVDFEINYGPRRAGDPAILLADTTKIKTEWNWEPEYKDIKVILQTAWQWEQKQK